MEAGHITHHTPGSYHSMMKYKSHIRSLMHRLFDKAMFWELIDIERNPVELVEVKGISKRKKRPRILQPEQAWKILDGLVQPY